MAWIQTRDTPWPSELLVKRPTRSSFRLQKSKASTSPTCVMGDVPVEVSFRLARRAYPVLAGLVCHVMFTFVLSRGCAVRALVDRVDPAEVMARRHSVCSHTKWTSQALGHPVTLGLRRTPHTRHSP